MKKRHMIDKKTRQNADCKMQIYVWEMVYGLFGA